jgi:hypothetical protein
MANANTSNVTVVGGNNDFLVPQACYSPNFNPTMTLGLDSVDDLTGGYYLISGNGVLMEARSDSKCYSHATTGERSLSIYICNGHLMPVFGDEDGPAPRVWDIFIRFLDQLECEIGPKGLGIVFVKNPEVHDYGEDHPEEYRCLPRTLDLLASTSFHFRNTQTGDQNFVKVNLALLSWSVPLVGPNQTVDDFQSEILFSYCINICRISFDVRTRTITFPTQPDIFGSVLARTFYCDLGSESGRMGDILGTIAYYQFRLWKFIGFLDVENERFFNVAENRVFGAD